MVLNKQKEIKAIIVWRHNETISLIAKEYNLKVIEMELSAIRKPIYNLGLSYFQFSNKYSENEFNKRYENLKKEIKENGKKIPVLTRKQIINLFFKRIL